MFKFSVTLIDIKLSASRGASEQLIAMTLSRLREFTMLQHKISILEMPQIKLYHFWIWGFLFVPRPASKLCVFERTQAVVRAILKRTMLG